MLKRNLEVFFCLFFVNNSEILGIQLKDLEVVCLFVLGSKDMKILKPSM